jgi:hypothetical protein
MSALRHPLFLTAARTINALFCLTTTIYAMLTSSPFAYEQFIQPNMVAWLSNFVFLYADFYWLSLCITFLSLAPYLGDSRGRAAAWSYLAAAAVVGSVILFIPILPSGQQPTRSAMVAFAALVPIAWLAVIDRLTAPPRRIAAPLPAERMLAICVATAVVVWAIYASAAPLRLASAGGLTAGSGTRGALAIGIAVAAVLQLVVATIAFLIWQLAGRAWPAVCALVLGCVLQRVVFLPIAISGPLSWAIAIALAAAVVLLVSGIGRHAARLGSRAASVWTLAALPLAAYVLLVALTTFDWGFMLQKLSAVVVAAIAFTAVQALASRTGAGRRMRAGGATAPWFALGVLAVYAATLMAVPRIAQTDFILDAYSAADPSYRLNRQFLDSNDGGPNDAAFYSYLRANSSLAADVAPVSIDFVPKLTAAAARPPDIYLFIIDSLRRDYLSAYNSAVSFTPRLAEFARDSVVFERALSRYGGTGLSVPSIWAGALLPHKQYVTPFAPMNALGKLLDAGGYRRVVTRDHITDELFGFPEGSTALDTHIPEMMHTLCGTIAQLTEDLHEHRTDPRPVFAHTRPLDLHIGNTRLAAVPAGESYPGFFGPYAARVKRIDGCFGELLDSLKRTNRYDDSIIVVMSDHGDSLGEGLRWGHGYTVVPEVIRIPLLIHLPASIRDRFVTDSTRVSFATDVTPTLYALLGYAPQAPRAVQGMAGTPLFAGRGAELRSRRKEAFAVASSYGAVYGVVRDNGRRLYIADAIEGRDYLYDLTPAGRDARIGMTDADRVVNRALIREQVADLAEWYGLQR